MSLLLLVAETMYDTLIEYGAQIQQTNKLREFCKNYQEKVGGIQEVS